MRVVKAPPLDMPLGLGALARLRPSHSRGHRSSHPACSSGQESTPLLDAVRERGNCSSDIPFHVPGHKARAEASKERLLLSLCVQQQDACLTPPAATQLNRPSLMPKTGCLDAAWPPAEGRLYPCPAPGAAGRIAQV